MKRLSVVSLLVLVIASRVLAACAPAATPVPPLPQELQQDLDLAEEYSLTGRLLE